MRNLLLAVALVLMASGAQATLIDRGEGFIYDDVLDITWAQNANINGSASWDTQMAWAAGYSQTHSVYGTFSDWRLPATLQPDPTCSSFFLATYADGNYGYNCAGSEMGHLFNVDGISSSSMGLFTDLHFNSDYWSSYYRPDVDGPNGHLSIYFGFASGYQSSPTGFEIELGALAVRDGDIAPVPEPSTALLLGLGLVGLAARRRV